MTDAGTTEGRFGAFADEFGERQRQGQKASVEGNAAAHADLVTMEAFRRDSGDATGDFDAAAVVVRGTRLERLGDFRVLREAGRGGMGVVYEAEQESLGRRVALKVLAAHAIPDPAQVRRFEREARAAAQLHHTNIVPVFGVGEQDGLHYYVMQFIPGLGLDNVIDAVNRFRSATGTSTTAVAAPPESGEGPGGIAPTAAGIAWSLVTEQFVSTPQVANEPSSIEGSGPDELGMTCPSPPPMAGPTDLNSEGVLGTSGLSSASGSDAEVLAERGAGRPPGRRRPGVRPRPGHLAPRHQALQRPARLRRGPHGSPTSAWPRPSTGTT